MSQPPRQPLSLRPLTGRRIVVTRAREQAAELVDALTKLGAQVIAAPTIRIEPLTDLGALRAALAEHLGMPGPDMPELPTLSPRRHEDRQNTKL